MTEQHKATPDMWASIRQAAQPRELAPGIFAGESTATLATGLIDLCARVEALEATQHANIEESHDRRLEFHEYRPSMPTTPPPSSSLVERVGQVIADVVPDEDGFDLEARAVIREVAKWLMGRQYGSDHVVHTAWEAVKWLEQEAA